MSKIPEEEDDQSSNNQSEASEDEEGEEEESEDQLTDESWRLEKGKKKVFIVHDDSGLELELGAPTQKGSKWKIFTENGVDYLKEEGGDNDDDIDYMSCREWFNECSAAENASKVGRNAPPGGMKGMASPANKNLQKEGRG